MPINLVALKSELTQDPLGRNYAALGDEAAAVRINVIDRPFDGISAPMLTYLAVNKNRTNTGTDTVNTSMLGRLILAAGATIGTDPFGSGVLVTLDMKCSALALLEILRSDKLQALPFQTNTLQQLLTDMISVGVMKVADKTAIIALSDNRQSRASELNLGGVPTTSDVAAARRLP